MKNILATVAAATVIFGTAIAQPQRLNAPPADVQAAIRNTAKSGDVVVIKDRWRPTMVAAISGDHLVVKAETFTVASGADIVVPPNIRWVAFVAKTWKFAEPGIRTQIWSEPRLPVHGESPAPIPDYPPAPKAGAKDNGPNGAAGANGRSGGHGANGYNQPTIYLFADTLVNQSGVPLPSRLNLRIFAPGGDGGSGGQGQNGQNGQHGGSGGDGQPGLPPRNAGSGGAGGMGGIGGAGGNGGASGNGANVYYVGSDRAVDFLEFAIVDNPKGTAGARGEAGRNGAPGSGGPRGSHPGNSGGGSAGPDGPPQSAFVPPGNPGPDSGKQGLIYAVRNFDLATLY